MRSASGAVTTALATLAVRQEKEDKKTRLLIRCIEKGLPDHA